MLFNSLPFLILFPVVLLLRWGSPRYSLSLLLVASYAFYAFGSAWFLPYLIGLTLFNYLLGRLMPRLERRWLILVPMLAVNLGVLAFFKYGAWFREAAVEPLLGQEISNTSIVAPLAISFFTFEFVHYAVEVYRGSRPVTNIKHFFVFATFFPSQIAGPIKRYGDFVPQLLKHRIPTSTQTWQGLGLLGRGYLKKVVFADNLAILANSVFASGDDLSNLTPFHVLVGIYAFAWQIYFDFSGYTDIGRGLARLLGFRLPENFRSPYTTASIREFWRRWHMTLSTWLRDYLYVPLGGSRVPPWRIAFNLMATMTLGGLWHGAGLQFIAWGAYHGTLLSIGRFLGRWIRLPVGPGSTAIRPLAVIFNFHLICLGWVLFRSESLGFAVEIIRQLASGPPWGTTRLAGDATLHIPLFLLFVGALGSVLANRFGDPFAMAARLPRPARWVLAIAAAILLFSFAPEIRQPFIYFQF
jgi:alginate O-acetyltransferase complex protein AlgI